MKRRNEIRFMISKMRYALFIKETNNNWCLPIID